jgi:hypothetical protein
MIITFALMAISATKPPYDNLGVFLPEGVTSEKLIKLIAPPNTDFSLVTLVGMKKWPYKKDTYAAIACFSPDKREFKTDTSFSSSKLCCNSGYGGFEEARTPKKVYLALVEYTDELKVIAKYNGPLDVKTCWENSNIDNDNINKTDSIYPGSYDRFDFAKYKVSDDKIGFGIRVSWQVMYAGGGGYFQALMLFIVNNDKIINILSEPMGESGISGTVNDKSEWETINILQILPSKTNGFYDLQLKENDGEWKKIFKWNPETSHYIPAD